MRYSSKFVRPLQMAENSFLQVLLTQFTLQRAGQGTNLSLQFNSDMPAIWTRQAKDYLKSHIPAFARKAAQYQRRLNAVLVGRTESSLTFHDADFPFRYCSGGALPVLRMGDREFYCLFYRDIYPIGWNIANGGSDSRAELLAPLATMERELREELIVLNPARKLRYVFTWDSGTPEDRAEFALARRIWGHAFPEQDIAAFAQLKLPLKWLDGPDSVSIRTGDEPAVGVDGCWVNINAGDFGIELDKVAWINVDEDAVLLDGELLDNKVLDRPVGLFEVDRMDQLVRKGDTRFLPDIFFHHGRRHDGSRFEEVIATDFTSSLKEVRNPSEIRYFKRLVPKFDLCPVTRAILVRASGLAGSAVPPHAGAKTAQRPEVFISCGRGDEPLARSIYDFVTTAKRKSAFFYEEDRRSDWGRQIDDALSSASCLIIVGTDSRRMNRRWPQYEWGSFHNAILSGRKPRTAKLIPFAVGIRPQTLPWALHQHRMVVCRDVASGLLQLDRLL